MLRAVMDNVDSMHEQMGNINRGENPETCQSPSRAQLFVTPWTVALEAPLSMEFSRQGY